MFVVKQGHTRRGLQVEGGQKARDSTYEYVAIHNN